MPAITRLTIRLVSESVKGGFNLVAAPNNAEASAEIASANLTSSLKLPNATGRAGVTHDDRANFVAPPQKLEGQTIVTMNDRVTSSSLSTTTLRRTSNRVLTLGRSAVASRSAATWRHVSQEYRPPRLDTADLGDSPLSHSGLGQLS